MAKKNGRGEGRRKSEPKAKKSAKRTRPVRTTNYYRNNDENSVSQSQPLSNETETPPNTMESNRAQQLKTILRTALATDSNRVRFVEDLLRLGMDFTDYQEERYRELIEALRPFKIEPFIHSGPTEETEVLFELLAEYALESVDCPTCNFEIELVKRVCYLLPEERRIVYLQRCKRDFEQWRVGITQRERAAPWTWPNNIIKLGLQITLAFGDWCAEAIETIQHETKVQQRVPKAELSSRFGNHAFHFIWIGDDDGYHMLHEALQTAKLIDNEGRWIANNLTKIGALLNEVDKLALTLDIPLFIHKRADRYKILSTKILVKIADNEFYNPEVSQLKDARKRAGYETPSDVAQVVESLKKHYCP